MRQVDWNDGSSCVSWRVALALFAAALVTLLAGCREPAVKPEHLCHAAAYRLPDGRVLDISPVDGKDLRWIMSDGRRGLLSADSHWASSFGWTEQPDGVAIAVPPCGSDTISFRDKGDEAVKGIRIPLTSTEVEFKSGEVTLIGRLVLPTGSDVVPVVVQVHGSEKDSALDYNAMQRLLPAAGVGAFVYDKRGTGRSSGSYTQDFNVLADDAAAAVLAARRLAGARLGRIGFEGTSQGGWIAPLASLKTPVDFVIVDFGLAGSVAEENRDQTVIELKRKGYGPTVLAAAGEVADATSTIIASHFRDGFDELNTLRARYGSEPWFHEINGQYAGELLGHSNLTLRIAGPFLEMGTPIYYDAMAALRKVQTPMLWVLAGDDTLAPSATTQIRLRELAAMGKSIAALVFPNTDHGIREFITSASGARTDTRYADGYFRTTIDFARSGQLAGPYGNADEIIANLN